MKDDQRRLPFKRMNYCEFIKCHWGEERFDVGGCSTAWSGETCWTLYSAIEEKPILKFEIFEFYLEEHRMNVQGIKYEPIPSNFPDANNERYYVYQPEGSVDFLVKTYKEDVREWFMDHPQVLHQQIGGDT